MSKKTRNPKNNKPAQGRSCAHDGKRSASTAGRNEHSKGNIEMEKHGQYGVWVDFGGLDSFATATHFTHRTKGIVTILSISVQSERPELHNKLIFDPVGAFGRWFSQTDLDGWIQTLYNDQAYYQEILTPAVHQINGVSWMPLLDQRGLVVPRSPHTM